LGDPAAEVLEAKTANRANPVVLRSLNGTDRPGLNCPPCSLVKSSPPTTARGRDWIAVAYAFLIMEFLSVGLMGMVIKNMAEAYRFRIDYPGAYLLASSLAATGIIGLASLALSCGLVYHRLDGLYRSREGASAMVMTMVILALGFGLWLSMLTVAFG